MLVSLWDKKIPLLIILLLGLFFSQVAYSCPSTRAFDSAYDNKEMFKLKQFSQDLKTCNETIRNKYRYFIARALYDNLTKRKHDEDIVVSDYDEIKNIHPEFWAVLADLGDHSLIAQNYQGAFRLYERALAALSSDITKDNDIISDMKNLPKSYIIDLKSNLDNARLLASLSNTYIEPVLTRGMLTTRGVSLSNHKYPILFEYDSSAVKFRGDNKNKENLNLLLRTLKTAGNPSITITGHTDYKGSPEYNIDLSKRRATTIKKYLQKEGYKGRIKTIGKGKEEPIQLHPRLRAKLSDEDWRQLNRRVETFIIGK